MKDADPESDTDHESLEDPDELCDSCGELLGDPDPDGLLLEDGEGAGDTDGAGLELAEPVQSPVRVGVRVSRADAEELLVAERLRDIVFGADVVGVDDADREVVTVVVDVIVTRTVGDPVVVEVPELDVRGDREFVGVPVDDRDDRGEDEDVRVCLDDPVDVVLSEYVGVS